MPARSLKGELDEVGRNIAEINEHLVYNEKVYLEVFEEIENVKVSVNELYSHLEQLKAIMENQYSIVENINKDNKDAMEAFGNNYREIMSIIQDGISDLKDVTNDNRNILSSMHEFEAAANDNATELFSKVEAIRRRNVDAFRNAS